MGDLKHSEHLLVAVVEHTGCIRVLDRGTFKISGALKQFGTSCMDRGVTRIVFDMSDCTGMDSTFMGVIAGMAFRLKKKNGNIIMIGLTDRTQSLLSTLGLDQLVEPFLQGVATKDLEALFSDAGQPLEKITGQEGDRRETTELMLEAHSALVELKPENQPKFKDVLTFLKEDLGRIDEESS